MFAFIFCLHAQYYKIIMHSNKKVITFYNGGGENEWTINPSLKPDIFRHYSETETFRKFRFISDIDSLEFNVEINKPIYFSIIYNGDIAHTVIEFINYIPNTLSDEQKLYALSLFWSEAKYNFAFIEKLHFDLDSLYIAYIPKISATKNDYEFYNQMQIFVGHFKDGHTNVNFNYSGKYTDYIDVTARYFGDNLYIIRTREDIEKYLPIGSKILEINGMTTNDYIKQHVEPYIESDFEPTVKALSAAKLFSSNLSSNLLTVKYITPDDKIMVKTLPRDGKKTTGNFIGYSPKRWEKPIEINWIENDIAVLGFHTFVDFGGKLVPFFEKLKDTLYHAKGIIIDLRQNGGGSTDVAEHLLKYLIKDTDFLTYAWQTRINDGVKKANGNWIEEYEDYYKDRAYRTVMPDTIYISDSIKRFNVPITILISTMTVSAAEDFLIMLYERNDRPKFIGRPSFGSTGSPLVIWDWPDENGFARICARRVLFPYSLKPFTEGIMPDILVEYTFDEFMSGKDKDIEIAVKELEKQ
jgi:hypothetical protein